MPTDLKGDASHQVCDLGQFKVMMGVMSCCECIVAGQGIFGGCLSSLLSPRSFEENEVRQRNTLESRNTHPCEESASGSNLGLMTLVGRNALTCNGTVITPLMMTDEHTLTCIYPDFIETLGDST